MPEAKKGTRSKMTIPDIIKRLESLRRYYVNWHGGGWREEEPDKDGEWIKQKDVEALIEELRAIPVGGNTMRTLNPPLTPAQKENLKKWIELVDKVTASIERNGNRANTNYFEKQSGLKNMLTAKGN